MTQKTLVQLSKFLSFVLRHRPDTIRLSMESGGVGGRYGKPVILRVLAKEMVERGYRFYRSENQVWLTDHVPPEFIGFP